MNKYAKTLFELVKSSIDHNSKALAKRLARVSGAKSRPAVRQRLESQIRETLEQQTWDLLCLFDNVGCRLPNDVLGYRILASPTRKRGHQVTHGRPADIRNGNDDYSDMWLSFCSARADKRSHDT